MSKLALVVVTKELIRAMLAKRRADVVYQTIMDKYEE